MAENTDWISILIADDSKDDCHLLRRAFQEAKTPNRLDFVHDGQQLLDFLAAAQSLPGIILLDLNMPRLDGKEALKAIRADARLSLLPVLILSTSNYKDDVLACYRMGANAVMAKPLGYDEFVDLVFMVKRYWLEHVQLPARFLA